MTGLNRDDKERLAAVLIQAAADLLEPPEEPTALPAGIDRDAAAEQLARWLKALPGWAWDELLPPVEGYPRTRRRSAS